MIALTKEVLARISADGAACYPEECCGIIFGTIAENGDKTALFAEPVENGFDEREKYHRFEITPEIMLKAERAARKKRLDIVGFYHSHPNCKAFPSEYDRAHALPVYSYIIVSVVKGSAADTRSFVLSAENMQFSEEKILIEE